MQQKIVIYSALTRLWGNKNTTRQPHGTLSENGSGKLRDFTPEALAYIRSLGATHVWYIGLLEHATKTDYSAQGIRPDHPDTVKGQAGSPYAVKDYYDVDPDLAEDPHTRQAELDALIKRTHQAGLQVLMDFIPNHVARTYHSDACPKGVADLGATDDVQMAFSPRNNFYYLPDTSLILPLSTESSPYTECPARATGNDCFSPYPSITDWYETVKLNYGIDYNDWAGYPSGHFSPVPGTWIKMTDILLFWASKGVDAFRCDMAEMVPCAFWSYASAILKSKYPDILLIGEVYDPQQYRNYISAGFDYLYDKVGMYDTLRAIICDQWSTNAITQQWQNVDDIRERMLYFLENHDEQRIASDFFAGDAWKAIPALIISALLYKNPLMIYAGQEYGERGMDKEGFSGVDGRTTIFDYWCVDTLRRGFFDRRKLTTDEKKLEQTYQKILGIAVSERAVNEGLSFDLMYANHALAPDQYAFIRSVVVDGKRETLLVAVNFCEYTKAVPVNIPSHAFSYLSLAEGDVEAVDLLTGDKTMLSLHRDETVSVSIPANGGVVLKF